MWGIGLRILFGGMRVLAGTGVGIFLAGQVHAREEQLRCLLTLTVRLEQMVLSRLPTGVIRERLVREGTPLLPPDKEEKTPEGQIRSEILAILGNGSGEEQAMLFKLLEQRLQDLLETARKESLEKGRLFPMLGCLFGLFWAVIG